MRHIPARLAPQISIGWQAEIPRELGFGLLCPLGVKHIGIHHRERLFERPLQQVRMACFVNFIYEGILAPIGPSASAADL